MKEFLYTIVYMISKIHNRLMGLNDAYEYNFSDKELHFIVIGVLGMLMIFVVYPFFKSLAKHGDRMDLCIYTDHRDHICNRDWTESHKYRKYGLCRYCFWRCRIYRIVLYIFLYQGSVSPDRKADPQEIP